MRSKLLRKITETSDNLHEYMKVLEETKELYYYYLSPKAMNIIDNHIKLAQEFELEVNRVLSIAKDTTMIIHDMPDTINKLCTVDKTINYRLSLLLQ